LPKISVSLTEKDVEKAKHGLSYEKSLEEGLIEYFKKFKKNKGKGVLFYKLEGKNQADYMNPHVVKTIVRNTRDGFFGKGKGPDVVVEITDVETQIVVGANGEQIYEKGKKKVWP